MKTWRVVLHIVSLLLAVFALTPLLSPDSVASLHQEARVDLLDVIIDPPDPKIPRIEVTPTSLDFEEVAVDATAERELRIWNVGDATLWVGSVAIAGGAASPFDLCGITWTARSLLPGRSVKVSVCFSPKTPGLFDDEVIISSNDPDAPTVAIPIRGSAVLPKLPKIEVTPTSLDFEAVTVNTTAERELTVSNVGDADLWVSNVAIAGGAASPFDLCGITWTAGSLPPGGSVKVSICFSPKTAGLVEDELIISSNDPNTPTTAIPVQGSASRKKSSIACTAMGRPKPDGRWSWHDWAREAEVIVNVEISPPLSVEYRLEITDANGGTHGPFIHMTDADGKDRRLLEVMAWMSDDQAINGTWECHVSWDGDDEYEGASSQCSFDVSELGSYERTTTGPATNRIDIRYDGFCTGNCTQIVFIQVLSEIGLFVDGTYKALNATDLSADWTFYEAVTVNATGRRIPYQGYCVDKFANEMDPYFNDTPYYGAQGAHNLTASSSATTWDPPYTPDDFYDSVATRYGQNATMLITEFETFAFCAAGADKGKFYEGILWTYQRGRGDAGLGAIDILGVVAKPSQGFMAALEAFCKDRNFALPKPPEKW